MAVRVSCPSEVTPTPIKQMNDTNPEWFVLKHHNLISHKGMLHISLSTSNFWCVCAWKIIYSHKHHGANYAVNIAAFFVPIPLIEFEIVSAPLFTRVYWLCLLIYWWNRFIHSLHYYTYAISVFCENKKIKLAGKRLDDYNAGTNYLKINGQNSILARLLVTPILGLQIIISYYKGTSC